MCAIEFVDLSLEAASVDKDCCFELDTRAGSHIAVCIDKSVEDCPRKAKMLASGIRKKCIGNMPSEQAMHDFERDTDDHHENGNWRGWVFHAKLDQFGRTKARNTYFMDVDSEAELVSFSKKKNIESELEFKFYDLKWPCKDVCSPYDYGLSRGNTDFDEATDKIAEKMGPSDSSNCIVLEFDDFGSITVNLVCVIDVN